MTGPRVIRRDAVIPVHEANALTGEVPCWDARNGRLWWADIQGQRLLGFSPASGRQETHNLPGMLGLIVLRAAGGLVLGLEDGLYPFDPATGLGPRLVAVEADDARTRLNDGAADASGRLWFGTMDKTGSGEPIGGLYCLADGAVRRVRSNVSIPNSINISPRAGPSTGPICARASCRRATTIRRPASSARAASSPVIPRVRHPTDPASTRRARCGSPSSAVHGWSAASPTARSTQSSNCRYRARPCRGWAGLTAARFSSPRSGAFSMLSGSTANPWRAIFSP